MMELKNHQKEALEIIRKVWKEDITWGQFVFKELFSYCTVPPYDLEDKDVMNLSGLDFENSYFIKTHEAMFLLRDCDLIDNLQENRILYLYEDYKRLVGLEIYRTPEEVADYLSDIDEEEYKRFEDTAKYWNFKEKYPTEEINDYYAFRVTNKCKFASYEGLEEIIVSHGGISRDPTLGEFNDVQLKKSGVLTYKKKKCGSIRPDCHQYNLLSALISKKDKSIGMTTIMILEYLEKPSVGDVSLLLPEDTYMNLNKTFNKYKLPLVVSKNGEGYILKASQ